jgi:hypothetical protein
MTGGEMQSNTAVTQAILEGRDQLLGNVMTRSGSNSSCNLLEAVAVLRKLPELTLA